MKHKPRHQRFIRIMKINHPSMEDGTKFSVYVSSFRTREEAQGLNHLTGISWGKYPSDTSLELFIKSKYDEE